MDVFVTYVINKFMTVNKPKNNLFVLQGSFFMDLINKHEGYTFF